MTVTDAQGNPVPGETVTFRAPLSGPSADLSRLTDVTNGNGVTSIRAFANNKVGGYVVTGKINGIGTARFNLRNAAAPYFADGFSKGLRKWKRTGDISIARGAGRPAPSMLLRASGGKTFRDPPVRRRVRDGLRERVRSAELARRRGRRAAAVPRSR